MLNVPISYRPNIIIALFDSLGTIDSGLLEAPVAMPVLSTLSREGTLFSCVYAPCPESSPARASLFTGLDPCVHGLWTNGVELPRHEQTFPEILARNGYTTWLVGRRQLAGVANWTTEHPRKGEFVHVEWAHGALHRSRQNAYLAWLSQNAPESYAHIFPTQANADDTDIPPGQRAAMSGLPDNLSFNYWVGERVSDLISSHHPEQPFLAVAGFSVGTSMGTEPPHDHDGEDLDMRAYLQADASLGQILDQLATSNCVDDTVVIVTSGRGNTKPGLRDDPLNERSIRVPLLMRCSGQEPGRVDTPVSTIDIAPTVLDIAGLPIGSRIQGMSLLGMSCGSREPRGWAMSRFRRGSSSHVRNWQTAFRADNMKLLVKHGNPKEGLQATYRLFDLTADPDEHYDLACQKVHTVDLDDMIDQMIDARCALEDRTEPRIADF